MNMNKDLTADVVAKKWFSSALRMKHPFNVGYALHRDGDLKAWLDVIFVKQNFDVCDYCHIPLGSVKEANELYKINEKPYFVAFSFDDGLWYVKIDEVKHEIAVIGDDLYSIVPNTALRPFSDRI